MGIFHRNTTTSVTASGILKAFIVARHNLDSCTSNLMRGACGTNVACWLSLCRPKKSKGTIHSDHCKSALLLLRCLQVGVAHFTWMVMKSRLKALLKESNAIGRLKKTTLLCAIPVLCWVVSPKCRFLASHYSNVFQKFMNYKYKRVIKLCTIQKIALCLIWWLPVTR